MFWVYRYKGFSFTAARTVHTALVLSAAVGALLTVLGLVTAAPIMRLLGTPDEIFSKEEHLRAIGLDVPQVTSLAGRLNALGFDLPGNIHTMDDMEKALCAALGGEARA